MAHPSKNYWDQRGWLVRPCSQCKEPKSLDEYYTQKKSKDAVCYQSKCKRCMINNAKYRRKELWQREKK